MTNRFVTVTEAMIVVVGLSLGDVVFDGFQHGMSSADIGFDIVWTCVGALALHGVFRFAARQDFRSDGLPYEELLALLLRSKDALRDVVTGAPTDVGQDPKDASFYTRTMTKVRTVYGMLEFVKPLPKDGQ